MVTHEEIPPVHNSATVFQDKRGQVHPKILICSVISPLKICSVSTYLGQEPSGKSGWGRKYWTHLGFQLRAPENELLLGESLVPGRFWSGEMLDPFSCLRLNLLYICSFDSSLSSSKQDNLIAMCLGYIGKHLLQGEPLFFSRNLRKLSPPISRGEWLAALTHVYCFKPHTSHLH